MDLTELVHFDNANRHPWELARLHIIIKQLQKLIAKKSGPISILDVGCGDGFVVSELAKTFTKVQFTGYDKFFTKDQLSLVQKKYSDLNNVTYTDVIDKHRFQPNSVDFILLLDVIEHIEDEIQFLKTFVNMEMIKPDCQIIITVPAYQKLFAEHDVILGHYRRYTNHTLSNRLEKAGIIAMKKRYFFTSLLIPRFFQKLIENTRKSKDNRPSDLAAWNGGKLKSTLIKGILILDYNISTLFYKVGIKIPGLSNLAICKRVQ